VTPPSSGSAQLLLLVCEEGGLQLDLVGLQAAGGRALDSIDSLLADRADPPSRGYESVPASFFEKNELPFRSLVQPQHLQLHYAEVEAAAEELVAAVAADLPRECEAVHDLVNNAIHFKQVKQVGAVGTIAVGAVALGAVAL
jgi:hypothetical protein